nr:fimbrial protein [Rahnella ecdela]
MNPQRFKRLSAFVCTLPVILFSIQVRATDVVNINVTGNIVAAPCSVDTGSVSQTINFGQLLGTDLRTAGAASDWKSFQVRLNNCPAATVSATAAFSGAVYPGDPTLYLNNGSAANVAIQVVDDATKTSVKNSGSTMTVGIDPAQHNAIFALAGRIIAPAGSAGSGDINGVMQMTFTYQ